jgi:putative phage-type endonuclease
MNTTITPERERWLAERRTGIGGSDAGAILGLSPWATPVSVWLDKTGRAGPKPDSEAMRLGTVLEGYVADRYTEETGRAVEAFPVMLHRGCLLGNYDRLVVPSGGGNAAQGEVVVTDTLLECKTSSAFGWDDGVPPQYVAQVMHYMGLSPSLQHTDVACLFINAKRFEVFRVERDDEVIASMQAQLAEWWERYVVADTPPPPSNESDCRLLWARSNPGKSVAATEEVVGKLAKYRDAEAQIKVLEAESQKAKDEICAFMEDAEVLVGPDGKPLLTWKSSKDSSKVDWEGVARSLGAGEEVIAAHTVVKAGSRRFTPKAVKSA